MRNFPELMLGSYPRIGDPDYRVKLTLESKNAEYLERAFRHLMGLLPADGGGQNRIAIYARRWWWRKS